jgi:hypothetical protein
MENEKPKLIEILEQVGKQLEFDVRKEVMASESAYVDMVWFDKRFPLPGGNRSFNMRLTPFLPVVGFEIERHTALNAKHVKGSVSNLCNLAAQLGVIVIGTANLVRLKAMPPYQNKSDEEIKQSLRDRVYQWVYAEAQPTGRIIVMFEDEATVWAERRVDEETPSNPIATTSPEEAIKLFGKGAPALPMTEEALTAQIRAKNAPELADWAETMRAKVKDAGLTTREFPSCINYGIEVDGNFITIFSVTATNIWMAIPLRAVRALGDQRFVACKQRMNTVGEFYRPQDLSDPTKTTGLGPRFRVLDGKVESFVEAVSEVAETMRGAVAAVS